VAISLAGATPALADCYVWVYACAPGTGIGPQSFFKDTDTSLLTQNDPNRCLQRAREYLAYCGPLGNTVATYYYSQSAWKTAVVVSQDASRSVPPVTSSQIYAADFAGNWIPLQANY
jgi:hypothetical protein